MKPEGEKSAKDSKSGEKQSGYEDEEQAETMDGFVYN